MKDMYFHRAGYDTQSVARDRAHDTTQHANHYHTCGQERNHHCIKGTDHTQYGARMVDVMVVGIIPGLGDPPEGSSLSHRG